MAISYFVFMYFQVKIIKCLVENIVVDISFNQLGGLCTLCFLVQVSTAFWNLTLILSPWKNRTMMMSVSLY
jgi:hypothetical protein